MECCEKWNVGWWGTYCSGGGVCCRCGVPVASKVWHERWSVWEWGWWWGDNVLTWWNHVSWICRRDKDSDMQFFLFFCMGVKPGQSHRGSSVQWGCLRIGCWGEFGHKRDEVTGEWRKLHNEDLNDLYSPSIVWMIISRRMSWAGHVAHMGEKSGVYRVLVGKPEGKKPLGRPRCRSEDNIKINLQEVGCRGVDWIDLVQVRDRWQALVNTVMNLRVP